MGVHTWEEALKDLTPEEVWAMRKIRMHLRAFLLSDGVEYSNEKSLFPEGYGELKRLQVSTGKIDIVLRSDDVPRQLRGLWLALDETIWSYGKEMVQEQDT